MSRRTVALELGRAEAPEHIGLIGIGMAGPGLVPRHGFSEALPAAGTPVGHGPGQAAGENGGPGECGHQTIIG